MKTLTKSVGISLLTFTILTPVTANSTSFHERKDVKAFINRLTEQHNFKADELTGIFRQAEIRQDIIEAISRPAESKPWHSYRPIFVTDTRTQEGVKFMEDNRETLAKAEQKYGVPAEVITAIIGVETRYGQHQGTYRVVDALATLGFEYEPRGKFFRKELEQFLLLSREESFDPLTITGSYAGAMGKPQFISSSYRGYAVDFDGDGARDLLNNTADAIGSVANYLARHGWIRGEMITVPASTSKKNISGDENLKPGKTIKQWRNQGIRPEVKVADNMKAALIALEAQNGEEYWLGMQNFYAITRYNRSPLYAMAVYQLSQAIKEQYQARQAQAKPNDTL